ALVGATGAGWVEWYRAHPDALSGFGLHPAVSSPNLNNTSAEARASLVRVPPRAEPDHRPPVRLPEPKPPEPMPATVPMPAPPMIEPARLVLEPTPVVAAPPVEEPNAPLFMHRGDSPMIRTWKMLGWPYILAFVMASPVPVAATEGPPSDSQRLDKIETDIGV